MSEMKTTHEAAMAHWHALADAGAQGAASALADLAGRAIEVSPPADAERDAQGLKVAAAIFFELLGGVHGELAVLLSEEICRDLVATLLGHPIPLDSEDASSALAEIGNVLASHAASGVAERLGESVLPTPPDLELAEPRAYLEQRRAAGEWWLRVETMLRDESGASVCALIWAVPRRDAPSR